jgi:AraC-like DNA-binding protein
LPEEIEVERHTNEQPVRICVYPPAPDLRPFVQHYYLLEAAPAGLAQAVAAWTKQALILQYGNRIRWNIGGGMEPVRDAALNGSVTKPYFFQTRDRRMRFFVVEFTDIGLHTLFRESAATFVDASFDALLAVPGRTRQLLCDALFELESTERKVTLVETFLRQLAPEPSELDGMRNVIGAVQEIRRSAGWIPMGELLEKLNVSERHLRRQFREVTGLAPKAFARVVRFSNALLGLVETDRAKGLYAGTYEALEHSYADQAHFNREFKEFTGYAPGNLPTERFIMYKLFSSVRLP